MSIEKGNLTFNHFSAHFMNDLKRNGKLRSGLNSIMHSYQKKFTVDLTHIKDFSSLKLTQYSKNILLRDKGHICSIVPTDSQLPLAEVQQLQR